MKLTTLKPRITTIRTERVRSTVDSTSWRAGKTSTERGYGYRWQQARAAHLAEHPLCVMCQSEGHVTAADVVDHETPHRGDAQLFWDRSQWQSLCKRHHDSAKQAEERRAGSSHAKT
jgi:5-methylcytosine-specific restriction endonuclease McrA